MADYPTLGTDSQGTVEKWRDPRRVSYSRANTVKARLASAVRKSDFVLHHRLSKTEYDTLKAFYDANRALSFTFTYSRWIANVLVSTDYTVIFGENNIEFPSSAAEGVQGCTVQLLEV